MKNLIIAFITLSFCNIAYAAYVNNDVTNDIGLVNQNIDLPPYFDDEDCHDGGYGATDCAIGAGVHVGGGVSAGCHVDCVPGTYACCGIRCVCKIYEQ